MATIAHIAFNCMDRGKQEAFYTKHFGFRRARVFRPGAPDEFVILRLGEVCLELFSSGAEAGTVGGVQPVGFMHLAFEVPDLDEAVAGLEAGGIQTEGIIDCSHLLPGMHICFFQDPEGNRVELMEGYYDEPG